jgi:hypothetical protein
LATRPSPFSVTYSQRPAGSMTKWRGPLPIPSIQPTVKRRRSITAIRVEPMTAT